MKNIYLFFLLSCSIAAYGQQPIWDWVERLGGDRDDAVRTLIVDRQNNIYALILCEDSVDFGLVTLAPRKQSEKYYALVKYSQFGKVIWATQVSTPKSNCSICIDSLNRLIIGGTYFDTLFVNSIPILTTPKQSAFLLCMNSDGTVSWNTQLDTNSITHTLSVVCISTGEIMLSGGFESRLIVGNDTLLQKNFPDDGHISFFDNTGKLLNSVYLPIPLQTDVALDGSIYACGSYGNRILVGSDTIQNNSSGYGMIVIKYNTLHQLEWYKTYGGNGSLGHSDFALSGHDIVLTGEYAYSIDIGTFHIDSAIDLDMFICKINSQGTPLWVTTATGTGPANGYSVDIDKRGNIYIAGVIGDTTLINTTKIIGSGGRDGVILKILADGSFGWYKTVSGFYTSEVLDIDVSDIGDVYVAGYFSHTAVLDTIVLPYIESSDYDGFIAKIAQPNYSVSPKNREMNTINYPNPSSANSTVHYILPSPSPVTMTLHDILGREVLRRELGVQAEGEHEETLDVSELPIGSYIVKISTNEKVFTSRISVVR